MKNDIRRVTGKWHFWSYQKLKTVVTTKWTEEITLHKAAQYYQLAFMQISSLAYAIFGHNLQNMILEIAEN